MTTSDDFTNDGSARRLTQFACAVLIVLTAAVSLADILNSELRFGPRRWPTARPPQTPAFSANDRSRWCTVWSLVERGTYAIDEIIERPGWDTIDKVRWKEHFYSSKPALLPTLVAGLYWTIKELTGWTLDRQPYDVAHLLLIIVNWLPWMIALMLIAVMANRYVRTGISAVFVVAAASFATFLSTFLITFNNHSVATCSTVFALYPATRIIADGRRSGGLFALCGFFAAFTVTNELPAFVFGAAMFVILLRQSWRLTCGWFIPAALIPLGGFFYTTYLASGGLVPFYAYFGTNVYEYVHQGIPSYWMQPQGIDAGNESRVTYFLNCLIGHHGIFSLSPIFLLTVIGWIYGRRWREFPLRLFNLLGLGLTLWMLLFVMYKTDNYGGNTSGLRWVFWLIPFWLLTMLPVLDEWGHKRSFRIVACLLLSVSAFSASYSRSNPWTNPWAMNVMQYWGLADYSAKTPEPLTPLQCWIPSLPKQTDSPFPFAEFQGIDHLGQTTSLRLTSQGELEIDGHAARHVRVERGTGYGTAANDGEQINLYLNEQAISAGAAPDECLLWPGAVSPREKRIAEIFLQGMPRTREYFYRSVRYLFTPLQTDAIECREAVSQIKYTPGDAGRLMIYRRTLWLSDRVPFGVLQFEDTVTDAKSNEVLFRQRLTLEKVSHLQPLPAATQE